MTTNATPSVAPAADLTATQDTASGALPTLYGAVQDLPGGSYVGPDGFREWRGSPTPLGPVGRCQRPGTARRLWTVSEEHTGVAFPEPLALPAAAAC